jgi:hypothetical protein
VINPELSSAVGAITKGHMGVSSLSIAAEITTHYSLFGSMIPRRLLGSIAVIIFICAYLSLLATFDAEVKHSSQFDEFPETSPYFVPVICELVALDGSKGKATFSVSIDMDNLSPKLKVGFNRLQTTIKIMMGTQEITFHKNSIPSPHQVNMQVDSGTISMYPLDKYSLDMDIYTSDEKDYADSDLDINVKLRHSNVYGYEAIFTRDMNDPSTQEVGYKQVRMYVQHTTLFMLYPTFVFVGLWAIAIGQAMIGWHIAIWHDSNMDQRYLTMSSSLLFGVPRFRMSIPMAPPFGCLFDYASFFWTEIVTVCVFVCMLRRALLPYYLVIIKEKHDKDKDSDVKNNSITNKSD